MWWIICIDEQRNLVAAFGDHAGNGVVRELSVANDHAELVCEYDGIDPVTQQPRPKLFWIRARLVRTQYERAPHLAAVRTNTVPAIQAQTVNGEVLGGTTGAPWDRHFDCKLAIEKVSPELRPGMSVFTDWTRRPK